MDSFRIVPARGEKTATVHDTSNSFGLHDTLKHGPRNLAAEIKTTSTIRNRLENWGATEDNLKLDMERGLIGLHMPLRKLMERKIVCEDSHMPIFPRSNIHLDILMGRDETLECADFMTPASETVRPMDIHADMEKKLGM